MGVLPPLIGGLIGWLIGGPIWGLIGGPIGSNRPCSWGGLIGLSLDTSLENSLKPVLLIGGAHWVVGAPLIGVLIGKVIAKRISLIRHIPVETHTNLTKRMQTRMVGYFTGHNVATVPKTGRWWMTIAGDRRMIEQMRM